MAKRRDDSHQGDKNVPPASGQPLHPDEFAPLPNMSLDEPTAEPPQAAGQPPASAEPTSGVFEAESVPEDARNASPASDIFAAEFLNDEPASISKVFDFGEQKSGKKKADEEPAEELSAEPASAVVEAEAASAIVEANDIALDDEPVAAEPASAIEEAEEASAVAEAQPALEVFAAEEVSLDDDEPVAAEPASAVVEAEEGSAAAEAQPASDVLAAEEVSVDDDEPVAAEPASAIVEAEEASAIAEAQPASEVFAAEEVSLDDDEPVAVEPASAIVEAEEASAVAEAQPASEVFAAEEVSLEDEEPVAAEPASAIVEAEEASAVAEAQPASEVFAAENVSLDDDEPVAAEPASAVVEAEEPFAVTEAQPTSEVFAVDEVSLNDEQPVAAEPASAIVEAEEASAVAEAQPASEVFAAEVVSLDDDEPVAAEPASAIVEAEEASAVAEAQPASEVFAAEVVSLDDDEPVAAEPASAIVEAEEASAVAEEQPASEVLAAEVVSLDDDEPVAAEPASAIVEAEEGSAVAEAQPASDVFAAEDVSLDDDEPVAAEPASAIVEAASAVVEAQPASEIVAAEEVSFDDDEPRAAEPASAIVEAEPASAVVQAQPASAVFDVDDIGLDEEEPVAAEPASAVVEAEAASAVVEAQPASEVIAAKEASLDEKEPVAAEPASAVIEAEPASAIMEAEDVSFDDEEPVATEPVSAILEAEAGPASDIFAAEDLRLQDENEEMPIAAEPASAISVPEHADMKPKKKPAQPDSAIVEAEAEPASSVFAAEEVDEPIAAEPASAIADAEPASSIFAAEVEEADEVPVAAEPASVVAEAEPASSVFAAKVAESEKEPRAAEPASSVFAAEEDGASSAEPASAVAEEAEPVSSSVFAAEEAEADDEPEVAEAASSAALAADVEAEFDDAEVGAEPASAVAEAQDAALDDEKVLSAESAASWAEAEARSVPKSPRTDKPGGKGKKPAKADDEVVEWDDEPAEELGTGEVAWEPEEEEAPPQFHRVDEDQSDETIAFEPLREKPPEMETEAIEGLSWDAPEGSVAKKKKKKAPIIEEEESVVEADEELVAEAEEAEPAEAEEVEEEVAEAEEVAEPAMEDDDEAVEVADEEIAEAEEEEEEARPVGKKRGKQAAFAIDDEETIAPESQEDEIAEAEEGEELEVAEAEEDEEPTPAAKKRGKQTAAPVTDDEVTLATEDDFAEAEEEIAEAEEQDEDAKPAKKGKKLAPVVSDEMTFATEDDVAEAEEEIAEAEEEDEPAKPAAKKRGKFAAALDEEVTVAEAEEDEPIAKPTGKKRGKQLAAAAEEVTVAEEDEDTKPATKKRGKVVALAEVEEEELVPVKKKGKLAKVAAIADDDEELEAVEALPVGKRGKKGAKEDAVIATRGKPKYGRRWLGGMILGWLLLGGAGYGIWYLAPDLLKQGFAQIPFEPEPEKPMAAARRLVSERKFPDAMVALGKVQAQDPEFFALRGEARWLDYYSKNQDKVLDPKNKDVTEARDDLNKGNNNLLVKQIDKTLEASGPREDADMLKNLTNSLRTMLVKSDNLKANDDTKTFSETMQSVFKAREEIEEKYNALAKMLAAGKFIDNKDKLDLAEFEKLMKDLSDNRLVLKKVNKLLENAEFKDPGDKGVAKLIESWKDTESKLADVNKLLADAKTKGEGDKGVKELIDARANLQTERDSLDTLIKQAAKELVEARTIPEGGDPRKDLIEGLKVIRIKAENPLAGPVSFLASTLSSVGQGAARYLDLGLENTALLAELKFYQVREPLIDSPEQKADLLVALLRDRRQKDPRQLKTAQLDADWLLSDAAKATPEIKAKAHYLSALAYRNQLKFVEAKQQLDLGITEGEVAKLANPKKGDAWLTAMKDSQRELTDPTVYYLPRIVRIQAAGFYQQAEEELNAALAAIPDDARLLARRAWIRLERVRSGSKYLAGKMAKEDQAAIRADAELAAKTPEAAGEAFYVLGLFEEELGNFTPAEQMYRQGLKAVEAVKGPPEEAGRIRVALARLLQRERVPAGGAPAALPESRLQERRALRSEGLAAAQENNEALPWPGLRYSVTPVRAGSLNVSGVTEDRNPGHSGQVSPAATVCFHPLSTLVAAALIGAQPIDDDEDPVAKARLKESIEIARELMLSDNPKIKGQGHLLMGQAMARQGRRTEGLRVYIEGLKLLYPGRETSELIKMMEEHPIFQQPDATVRPNPFLAEYHYAEGRRLYFDRKYVEAEKHLKQAVTFFDRDARYVYFLGLAQIAQRTRLKRDAADLSFSQAGKLEARNLPNFVEVNISLERIQGELRQFLDRYRMGGLNPLNE